MAKVVLIRPPMLMPESNVAVKEGSPSIGLAYVAAAIKEAGHEITVIDAFGEGLETFSKIKGTRLLVRGLTAEKIVERIPHDVDVIGISCMFSNDWLYSKVVIQEVHDKFPNVPIIGGGEHFTADPDYSFRSKPCIHSLVLGEGEETAVELIDAIVNNKPLESINGIAYMSNGQLILTPKRKRIRSIDNIAPPAWDDMPLDKYLDSGYSMSGTPGRVMPLVATRGCPFSCTFCSNPQMWGNAWVSRDPKLLIAEIVAAVKKYKVNHLDFYDLTAIVNHKWTLEFCRLLIAENLNVTWSLPSGTRSEALDEEVLKLMKQSGCNYLTYAPESGSKQTLKDIKKKVHLDKMLSSLKACTRIGITTKTNMVFGFPTQSKWQIFESLIFMVRTSWTGVNDSPVGAFVPYPGSELYFDLIKKGKIDLSNQEQYELFLAHNVYTDIFALKSYSSHVTDRQLKYLVIGGTAWFYCWNFLFRPWRVIQLVKNIVKGTPHTMLEKIILFTITNAFSGKTKKKVEAPESIDLKLSSVAG